MKLLSNFSAPWLLLCFATAIGQSQPPVTWSFRATDVTPHQATLRISARIAAGWHLYSQHMQDGGPVPTKFIYAPSEDYALQGGTTEHGNARSFYEDLYEMDVTWYEHGVEFSQVILLNRPVTRVKGKVRYMACSNDTCVPGDAEFDISVSPQSNEDKIKHQ